MSRVDLQFISKLMQQNLIKNEKCVRNLESYEGLSLEHVSLRLVTEKTSFA